MAPLLLLLEADTTTRKYSVAIAKIFSTPRQLHDPVDWVTIGTVEEKLADVFAADNANFDSQRFFAACDPR